MLVCGHALFIVGHWACPVWRGSMRPGAECAWDLAGLGLSGMLLTVPLVTIFMGIQLGGVAANTQGWL
ncbi:hypothetical protein [uncultured Desulfovibrio sp.]|uniref:hypothetical protein n=1 Tax=uncultured Desulfovibrio sp. TaxID=167968 RepID=UPI002632E565|nr:hypothetical protein [uncultured Desulfovibrio sp.]